MSPHSVGMLRSVEIQYPTMHSVRNATRIIQQVKEYKKILKDVDLEYDERYIFKPIVVEDEMMKFCFPRSCF